jgi:pimeloyl-ACP methyl ester carboxylesterase
MRPPTSALLLQLLLVLLPPSVHSQNTPYDVFPAADPPYYRVRYDAPTSPKPGALIFPVNYTLWVPPGVKTLRGLIVHQHGCGEGSCKSGLTGAFDLHWQALARKHDCALLAPAYEQPEKENCQMWCDPRNGSDAAFQRSLTDLGAKSGHPELATVPWALWGHSGGSLWSAAMALLHPDRVAAAWLRSGVPWLTPMEGRGAPFTISDAALHVPLMCNLGTKEGVTVKEGRFSGLWPNVEKFHAAMRAKGALIGIAVDPLTAHECGNQRYLAIPWLDACLTSRLPKNSGEPIKPMPTADAWLAPLQAGQANKTAPVPSEEFTGEKEKSIWLPNEAIAKAWSQYEKDTAVPDTTPPPAPTNLQVNGHELTWDATADLESGLAKFLIERDGKFLATVPAEGTQKNPFGRPLFQNLQYSDTPSQPLVEMRFTDTSADASKHQYHVISVNTAGLKSK